MKKTYVGIVVVVTLLWIGAIVFYLYQTQSVQVATKDENLAEIPATHSSVDDTTTEVPATSIDPTDRTLADLDLSFPNATKAIEGLVRVEDGVAELSDPDAVEAKQTIINPILHKKDYIYIYPQYRDSSDVCPSDHTSCVVLTPEEVGEFLIFNNNRTTLLHKYHTTAGYSLHGFGAMGDWATHAYIYGVDRNLLYFRVFRYENNTQKERINYQLDIHTGIITEVGERLYVECELDDARTSCTVPGLRTDRIDH